MKICLKLGVRLITEYFRATKYVFQISLIINAVGFSIYGPSILTGCAGVERNRAIRSTPHNSAQSKEKKSLSIRKFLLEILIKTGISIEYQVFQSIFRLFSDYLPSKATLRLRYPNNKAFLAIHDILKGLLGLMGRSAQVGSFISFDCF